MSEIQQQIADGARPFARVGDVIEHGQDIPANVRTLRDKVKDVWARQCGGWILVEYKGEPVRQEEQDRSDPVIGANMVTWWAPLTVVEVDPEPQPDPAPSGLCKVGPDRIRCVITDPDHRRIYHLGRPYDPDGFLRLKGTATGDSQLDPLPQPARCTNGPDCEVHPDADPEYTHEVDGTRMHHLGTGRMAPDPAAEQVTASAPLRERDELRAEVHRLTKSIESQIASREATDRALESIKDVVTRPLCRLLGVRGNEDIVPAVERLAAIERAARHELDKPLIEAFNEPAEPGPRVLTLPEPPPGAVALRGGARWVRSADFPDMWVLADGGSTLHHLGALLDREEGTVTVEFAPPREPRTWPKLDEAPADISSKVEVEGLGTLMWDGRNGEWLHTERRDLYSWGELRERGEVREVLT